MSRVHPLVGEAERLVRDLRLVGQEDGADAAEIAEALAVLGERARRAGDDQLGLAPSSRTTMQNSSPPIRYARPRPVTNVDEVLAEAREQRVAREVPEGVVVELEAVQVEEDEHEARCPGRATSLEVVEELAAVAEARQDVRARLAAGLAIIAMFSAKVSAMRAITARIAAPARASDSGLTRSTWS